MKIIITGSNGFIGKNLFNYYCKDDNVVLGINTKTYKLYKNGVIKNENFESLSDLNIKNFDIVYHFGWSGTAGREQRSNLKLQFSNLEFTLKFYKYCSEKNIKNFVYSASVYENEVISDLFFPEEPKLNCLTNIYGAAKISTNIFLNSIRNDKLPISMIRISNVFGIGSSENRFINYVLKNIHNNSPMELSSGKQLYDFIYIDDAIEAIRLIGEKGLPNKTYNLSSGNAKMLREFLIEIFDFFKVENYMSYFGKIEVNGKPLDKVFLCIDSLKSDLNYIPKTKFIDGVKKLYNHIYNA